MNNIMTQPKQPQQQDAPMHRAAPAGANLTNARTGGMVAPRGYTGGTASVAPLTLNDWDAVVQRMDGTTYPPAAASVPGPSNDARYLDPSANARGQLRLNSDGTLGQGYQSAVLSGQNWPGRSAQPAGLGDYVGSLLPGSAPPAGGYGPTQNALGLTRPFGLGAGAPIIPAGQDAPTIQPLPAGRGFGASAGVDFNSRNTFAPAPGPQVFAAPDPFAHMAGRGLPVDAKQAHAMVSAALGAPVPAEAPAPGDTYPVHVYGHNPGTGAVSDHVYQVQNHHSDQPSIQGSGPPVGSPEHAVANAHAYTPEGFHAATRGLSLYQLGLMSEIQQRMAQAHRTLQPYDPATHAFDTLVGAEKARADQAAADANHKRLLAGAVDQEPIQPDYSQLLKWFGIKAGVGAKAPNYSQWDLGGETQQ